MPVFEIVKVHSRPDYSVMVFPKRIASLGVECLLCFGGRPMSLDLSSLTNTVVSLIMGMVPLIVTMAVVKMLVNMFEGFGE